MRQDLLDDIHALPPDQLLQLAMMPAWVVEIADLRREQAAKRQESATPAPVGQGPSVPFRFFSFRFAVLAAMAACMMIATGYFLFRTSSPAEVQVNATKRPTKHLNDPPKARSDETWKLSVNFPGSGYVYVCSQNPDNSVVVSPKDSVQEMLTSNGENVDLRTFLDADNEWRFIICVTSRPAGAVIESAIRTSGISLSDTDPRAIAALQEVIRNATRQHGIRVIAFSRDVHVLGSKR
jgi:hypothetical protein